MADMGHCWDDVIPPDEREIYDSLFPRDIKPLGANLALIAIDLYNKVYAGGPGPVTELNKRFPGACGEFAWNAIPPTVRLFAAARRAGLPIIYTTGSTRQGRVTATNRQGGATSPANTDGNEIKEEFKPEPSDLVIAKERASGFFGTPMVAHLNQLGVRTVIMCGESTSGCLRASAVDAFSYGYRVVIAEECCFDRSLLSHKLSLFDLHHKYADVLHVDDIVRQLSGLGTQAAAE